jgi:RNA polymerase sigma factor (sigma-70 family)
MVLGVCRRVLRDGHAADDAFQATFLLLVHKARSLRHPDRLGPWLHGVAVRTALQARVRAARRREEPVTDEPAAPSSDEAPMPDLRPVLDAAIAWLPVKERAAVVLCHLEGLTYAAAAERLGCPLGTLAARLARARQRLRVRLTRQGLAPAAGLLSAGLAAEAPALPPALVAAVVRMAAALAAGTATGGVPESVLALVQGVRRTMLLNTWKAILAALVVFGLAGTGVGVLAYRTAAAESPVKAAPPAKPDAPPAKPLPPAASDKPHEGERMIPLGLLRQAPPDVYLLDEGDLLGVFVEGVLGERGQPIPLIQIPYAPPGANLPPPATGYPVRVREGSRVPLPLIEPLHVKGKSVAEVTDLITQAYVQRGLLRPGDARIIVSLAQPRTYRVTVIREDSGATPGSVRHPASTTLDLSAYENDVLTALARAGGLPGPDSNAAVIIQRGRTATVAEGGTIAAAAAQLHQVRIPWRVRPNEPVPFRPEDIILKNGDILVVESGKPAANQAGSDTAEPSRFGQAPPIMSLAVAMPDGRVLVQMSAVPTRPPAATRPDAAPAEAATSLPPTMGQWQSFGAPQFQAFETDGRPIDAKALADRLQKMTAVLVATDGRRPDALYLQAIKPGMPVLAIQTPVVPRPG